MKPINSLCLLGFGEVAQTLVPALEQTQVKLLAFDQQFGDQNSLPSKALRRMESIEAADGAADAASRVELIISAVTAEQSLAAATAAAGGIKHSGNNEESASLWFLDLNSVSPTTKQETAAVIEKAGGRYVEAAVMAPIGPKGIATPILLGGQWAESFLPIAQSLGFAGASCFDSELGKAAASKMCRSVLIKGLESLLVESLLTARHYGVDHTVVESLNNLMPGVDWQQHAAYMISRSLQHGTRRAEEMCEVAVTVQEVGIEPLMSRACADTQLWSAQFSSALESGLELQDLLDSILRLNTSHLEEASR